MVWITDYGYDETLHAFDKSAGKLGVDQIDLLILHQALPGEFELTIGAYQVLEKLLDDGKVRAIGVSNFMPDHLSQLMETTSIVPAVNQVEVHPYFRQSELLAFNYQHGILSQAWSPIGRAGRGDRPGPCRWRVPVAGVAVDDPQGRPVRHRARPAGVRQRHHSRWRGRGDRLAVRAPPPAAHRRAEQGISDARRGDVSTP
jgi:diketogulonate reductase-like aldo/keto reductase